LLFGLSAVADERKVADRTLNIVKKCEQYMSREQQRAELHRTIWKIANDLRGAVDGWDFKQYVLGFLFYRFVSENITDYLNKKVHATGNSSFDYASLTDTQAENARQSTTEEKGFYILPSELFENVRTKAKTDANLNETLERVFKHIEGSAVGFDSESDLKGLFDDLDLNSNKLGATVPKRNELLVKLIEAIGDMDLGNFQDNNIDAFGDAYEFLMQMYASNAGKSGGEFYTPQEVAELLAKITLLSPQLSFQNGEGAGVRYKSQINKVYDPCCGSGGLLLKFAKIIGKDNIRQGFFGQEKNITTYNLCRINMFLHDINFEKFSIAHGDTLLEPAHWDDEPFEAIVSNPPYSVSWDGDANPLLINDPRFSPAGVLAPKSKADLAFTMHMLSWLATNGTAAIVEFPGVLYRGGAEQKIRKYLIDNNYIDCVIQLPANLFFGVSIATCIIVLKKSKSDNATLFIDASKESIHSGNKEKLTEENINHILDTYINVRAGAASPDDWKHFAALVPNSRIAENDYNIAVSSYVEQEDTREAIDIKQLNAEIAEIVKRQDSLRKAIDEIVNDLEGGVIC
jgi:type I restriction enzyme M protein